ncbi:hypothetical protein POX_h09582 [Penicillium oxalicum]|uniref:hypothetical protein n=1 Tax=Penicillium oxalicum TaxID=69781 RepID=UPI0020B82378|nr:hypothetical protein POX_h09582 [Penicillium oxalicum]KAI2785822.1 hypothetical protein POX_h09582 [Penicillium oxalicum]
MTEKSSVSFRAEYKTAVEGLLETLRSDPKSTYSSTDLTELRVTLEAFNPEDPGFIALHACLFKPSVRGTPKFHL